MAAKGVDVTVVVSPLTQTDDPSPVLESVPTGSGLKLTLFNRLIATGSYTPGDFPVLGAPTGDVDVFGVTDVWSAENVKAAIPPMADVRVAIKQAAADLANNIVEALKTPTITRVAVAAYTVLEADDLVVLDGSLAGADIDVTLPLAAGYPGRILTMKNSTMGGQRSTLLRSGSDTIDGSTLLSLPSDYSGAQLQSDGIATWLIV